MNRRTFLATSAALTVTEMTKVEAAPASIPIIDCHIHLFDVNRPQGVPWPEKADKILYKTASMDRYRQITAALGIVGAIEVEASPWFDDNQWVLDIAAKDKMLVGTVGDLEPDKPDFRAQLDRLHKNPLFRGIRYGNIWDRDLAAMVDKPEFIAGMKMVADAGLSMDSADPDPRLIHGILRLSDKVPSLRIVIDHLPRIEKPTAAGALKAYEGDLRELGKRKQVFVKVSGVVRRVNGRIEENPAFYKSTLDEFFDIFGEDRLIYGSDWPHSDLWAQYPVELRIVRPYFMAKGQAVAEKYFWKNSVAAYRWVHRDKSQPNA
ncbi:MAG: amidohydrolase family protein [Terriglobia bacterium]